MVIGKDVRDFVFDIFLNANEVMHTGSSGKMSGISYLVSFLNTEQNSDMFLRKCDETLVDLDLDVDGKTI
jgi:hypothetical protein